MLHHRLGGFCAGWLEGAGALFCAGWLDGMFWLALGGLAPGAGACPVVWPEGCCEPA